MASDAGAGHIDSMSKLPDATLSYAGFLFKAIGNGRTARRGHCSDAEAGLTSLLCGARPGDAQDHTADWFEAMMAETDPPAVGAAH